jgi:hypothetical protein
MNIFGDLPAWAIVLLALLAGAMLIGFNYGWLLAAKAMLEGYRRKDDSASDAPAVDRDKPAQISGG